MSISEQTILDAVSIIKQGTNINKYINEYNGPEDINDLSILIRCKLLEDYSDEDIVSYSTHLESKISQLEDGIGKQRYQTILNALNSEKIKRNI